MTGARDTAFVRVAAAVILAPDGRVLLAQRPAGKAYAGYWEFPGGKLEPGESVRDALVRELSEELGLAVLDAAPWLVQRYVYPHAAVELNFWRVFAFDGEPFGHDGQAFRWQTPGRFDVDPLLPANTAILRALTLGTVCAIVPAAAVASDAQVRRIEARVGDGGTGLVCVDAAGAPPALARAAVARLRALAERTGARLLLRGADVAMARGCTGVLWSVQELRAAAARPVDLFVGASCADAADLARAGALGLDFAVLGSAAPGTPATTAAGDAAGGWDAFAHIAAATPLPVLVDGSLAAAGLAVAQRRGAHGIVVDLADR
jgi:8-oxo-dGTP diphosphatase